MLKKKKKLYTEVTASSSYDSQIQMSSLSTSDSQVKVKGGMYWPVTHTSMHVHIKNTQHLSTFHWLVAVSVCSLTALHFHMTTIHARIQIRRHSQGCLLSWPAFQIHVIPVPHKIMIDEHEIRIGCLVSCLSFSVLLCESLFQGLRQKSKESSLWAVGGHFR